LTFSERRQSRGDDDRKGRNRAPGGDRRSDRWLGVRSPADLSRGADGDAGKRSDQTAAERNPKYPEALPDGNPKTPATARRSEGGANGSEASPAAGARGSNYSADSSDRRRTPAAGAGGSAATGRGRSQARRISGYRHRPDYRRLYRSGEHLPHAQRDRRYLVELQHSDSLSQFAELSSLGAPVQRPPNPGQPVGSGQGGHGHVVGGLYRNRFPERRDDLELDREQQLQSAAA